MESDALLRMGLTLALLLAVPAALLWLLRRLGWRLPGQSIGEARLRIVARTAVDQKHVLLLVRRDAQEQLLLLGPGGPTVLEAAIRPTRADRAEQKRIADEEAERREAAEAAIAETRRRLAEGAGLLAERFKALTARLRRLLGRGHEALRPSFAKLVERARRSGRQAHGSRPAAPTRKAPAGRPRRARVQQRSA